MIASQLVGCVEAKDNYAHIEGEDETIVESQEEGGTVAVAWNRESLDWEVGRDNGSQDRLDHEDEEQKEEMGE